MSPAGAIDILLHYALWLYEHQPSEDYEMIVFLVGEMKSM